jgi:hypothetical protein
MINLAITLCTVIFIDPTEGNGTELQNRNIHKSQFYDLLYFFIAICHFFCPCGNIKHFTTMTMHKCGRKCQVT